MTSLIIFFSPLCTVCAPLMSPSTTGRTSPLTWPSTGISPHVTTLSPTGRPPAHWPSSPAWYGQQTHTVTSGNETFPLWLENFHFLAFWYGIQRLRWLKNIKHKGALCDRDTAMFLCCFPAGGSLSYVLTLCCLSAIRAPLCPAWSAAPRLATTGLTTTRSIWPEESVLRNTSSCPCPTSKFW